MSTISCVQRIHHRTVFVNTTINNANEVQLGDVRDDKFDSATPKPKPTASATKTSAAAVDLANPLQTIDAKAKQKSIDAVNASHNVVNKPNNIVL